MGRSRIHGQSVYPLAAAATVALLAILASALRPPLERSEVSEVIGIERPRFGQPERPVYPHVESSDASSSGDLEVVVESDAIDEVTEEPDSREPEAPPEYLVNVRDFGAVGDGVTDDSAAIQSANDDVVLRGGGVVHFPPGVYSALDLEQGSFVEFRGSPGSVLRHLDGVSPEPLIRRSPIRVDGSVEAGSTVLEVEDTSRFVEGAVVAVRGAGGPSPYQRSTLGLGVSRGQGTMLIREPAGFDTAGGWPNYLLVGDEMVSYERRNGTLLHGVQRGLYGTRAQGHGRGTRVAQLLVLYAVVEAIGPGHVVLDRPAELSVRGTRVEVGSVGMKLTGLTIDGNRTEGSNVLRMVKYRFARWVTVSDNVFVNAHRGALQFERGTRDGLIEGNRFVNNGTSTSRISANLWITRGATGITVRDNSFEAGAFASTAILVDDRSVNSSEFDASSSHNLIEGNWISLARDAWEGVAIFGSFDNIVRDNFIEGTRYGVRVYRGGQGTIEPSTSGNIVVGNQLRLHEFGLWVNGDANWFERNLIQEVRVPVVDHGSDNQFDQP